MPSGRHAALAAALFAFCLLYTFFGIWRQGAAEFVPSVERAGKFRPLAESDIRLAIWGASRNAWTLTHAPWRLYDAEPCYPTSRSLTLGHPMLSLGVLSLPLLPLGLDPVLNYNAVLAIIFMANALAMYLLVTEWTGVPAAGVVAGLLFAFHPVALDRLMHIQIYDLSWMLWALWFAQRLCTRGRWLDALGLAGALVMQMSGSFYAAAISALIGVPCFAWMLWRSRALRPLHVAVVAGIALLGAALIYGPYLVARASEEFERSAKTYLAWSEFLPGGPRDPGLWLWVLALCGLLAGRFRRAAAAGEPRVALVAAGLLTALAATGGVAGSHFFYEALSVIPGFGTVRVPSVLATGTHLALCALAGLGAAALIRSSGAARRRWIAAGLVAATLAIVLAPNPLRGAPAAPLYAFAARPQPGELAFYTELAARRNTGPVLELLVEGRAPELRSRSVLLTAYHHRPVSTCYNSIAPRAKAELEQLIAALPARTAQYRAHELGFTTIVIQHPPQNEKMQRVRERFEAAQAEIPVPLLRPLYATPWFSAYTLAEP